MATRTEQQPGTQDAKRALREHGLTVYFDDIIADETNHRDEIRQILARWP
jgi:rubrerythrin